jgi:hypothetical protein
MATETKKQKIATAINKLVVAYMMRDAAYAKWIEEPSVANTGSFLLWTKDFKRTSDEIRELGIPLSATAYPGLK